MGSYLEQLAPFVESLGRARQKKVERKAGDNVDDKKALQIPPDYLLPAGDEPAGLGVDDGGVEVQNDVDTEEDVAPYLDHLHRPVDRPVVPVQADSVRYVEGDVDED